VFPRFVPFNETDSLKNISQKVFKALRPLLVNTLQFDEHILNQQSDVTAHEQIFGAGSSSENHPYEMYVITKAGERFYLDPKNPRKLCTSIDTNQIHQFIVQFQINANFEEAKQAFQREFQRPLSSSRLGL